MIMSCADESGVHFNGPTPYVSLAGFIGCLEAWKAAIGRWTEIRLGHGLEEFRTSEWLRHSKPHYHELPQGGWLVIAGELIQRGINPFNLRGFAVQMSVERYRELGHSQQPYLVLFDAALSMLDSIMKDDALEEEALWTCFGRTASMEGPASRLYAYRMAQDREMRSRFYLESPEFKSPREQIGLEPADLLANTARNYVRGIVNQELESFLSRRNLRQIAGYNRTKFWVLDDAQIVLAAEHVADAAQWRASD